jgi:Mor family transcriptional regulator
MKSMGDITQEKKERNLALFADYKLYQAGKMKIVDIMQKYNLAQSRIYYIINRVRKSLEE